MRSTVAGIRAAWTRFFFEPQDTTTLGIFRIAFGVLVTVWALCHLPNLFVFYGPYGLLPEPLPLVSARWGVLNVLNTVPALSVVWLATLLGGIALIVGTRARLAAAVVFLGVLALERRNPYAGNAGDALIRIMAFYLMLAPSGAALSLARWRDHRAHFWTAPKRAPWALRLLQIQLSLIYLSTVWAKLQGETWREGTAVGYAMQLEDAARLSAPAWLLESLLLVEWLTFGTLLIEFGIGVLVWNRRARPWVLGLGVLLHLAIEVTLVVGFFSAAMLCLYLVFLSPETASRWLERARARTETFRTRTSLPDRDQPGEEVARST